MSNNTQAQEAKYFDLHTTGIGYLNRIREVPIRRGEPFLAVTVAALHGAADSVEYSYIDCKVVGAQAEKLVRRCKEAVEAEKKVLISFRIGDIWADPSPTRKARKRPVRRKPQRPAALHLLDQSGWHHRLRCEGRS